MSVWRSVLVAVIAAVIGTGVMLGGIALASAIAEAASNDPSGSAASGDGYRRGFGCTQNTGLCYAFGGGSLGSGSYITEVWNYEISSDTWSAQTSMPNDYYFWHNTAVSSDRFVGAIAGNSPSSCEPVIYDSLLDSWSEAGPVVPGGCGFGVVATGVGSTMYACIRDGVVECYTLDMSSPGSGWTFHSTVTGASNPQNGQLMYDENTQRLIYIDILSDTHIYEFNTGLWTDITDAAPITNGDSAVAFVDNRGGPMIGEMHTPATNSMEMYNLVYDEDSLVGSTWELYETWTDANFNYCSGSCNWRFSNGHVDLSGSGETFLMFGTGTASDSTPSINASRWWAYQGNSPLTEQVLETGNIDFWIEESLDLLDINDTFGHHLFGLFWLVIVALMVMRAGGHPLIMMFIVGLTAVGFGQADILPGWAILVALIVITLGAGLRMMGGQSSEGEPA